MARRRPTQRGRPEVYVRSVRAAVVTALRALGMQSAPEHADEVLTALMEAFEAQRLCLVPASPTPGMVGASVAALSRSPRAQGSWVDVVEKHAWRLQEALAARPDWREGLRREVEAREDLMWMRPDEGDEEAREAA